MEKKENFVVPKALVSKCTMEVLIPIKDPIFVGEELDLYRAIDYFSFLRDMESDYNKKSELDRARVLLELASKYATTNVDIRLVVKVMKIKFTFMTAENLTMFSNELKNIERMLLWHPI